MNTITSRDNPLYKECKQLAASAQARRKAGRTLLDGVHLAQAWLKHRGMPALCLVSQSALKIAEVAPLVAQCEAGGAPCIVLPDALHQTLSPVEHGVGLMLVIDTPQDSAPTALTEPAVLLDGLQDPGNLGSILRSTAAAGIKQVICSPGTVSAWSPKVLRAGMSAHFLLRIAEQVDLHRLIPTARLPLAATSSHGAVSLFEAPLNEPVCWLFGNEGQGVSTDLLQASSLRVAIPQPGGMESLNVAAAAAICLFEGVRQQRSRMP